MADLLDILLKLVCICEIGFESEGGGGFSGGGGFEQEEQDLKRRKICYFLYSIIFTVKEFMSESISSETQGGISA
jgi:hypothetical protein